MENHRIPALSWAYCYQGQSVEDLRHSLLCTTLELETTRLAAQEEIRKRDDEIKQLRDLLSRALRERDEANDKFQALLLSFQQQQQHQHQHQQQQKQQQLLQQEEGVVRRGDSNTGLSSSECEESIVSGSSPVRSILEGELSPLPEKGKLLQSVMKAGPLLQTLLLAGPLPQWRHPPPPLDSFEIPPVTIHTSSTSPLSNPNLILQDLPFTNTTRKRDMAGCLDSDDSSSPLKFRRVLLH